MVRRTVVAALAMGLAWTANGAEPSAALVGAQSAIQQAEQARNGGDPQRAVRILEDALAECGAEKQCQVVLLFGLGLQAKATGDLRTALARFEKVLPMLREMGDRFDEAPTLDNIGKAYADLGQKQKALEYFELALPIRREVGDRVGEAVTLNELGRVCDSMGQRQKALEHYEHALSIIRGLGDRSGEAATLNNIGRVYDSLGQAQNALEYYERALPISREVRSRSGEAEVLNNIGFAYTSLGQKQKALEYFEPALPIWRELGNRSGEAMTLNNIGSVYLTLGQKQKALEYLERALRLQREVGDRSGEARTLNNLGGLYDSMGQKQKAVECFERVLLIWRDIGERFGEAVALANVGHVYDSMGQKQKALESFALALRMQRELGDRSGEAATLNNIGSIYSSLGQKQKALEYFEHALPIYREVGDRSGETATLNYIGNVYEVLGQKEKALEYYERALPILREVGDRRGEAGALNNVGSAYSALGQMQKALEYFERALPTSRGVGDRVGEAWTLNNMGGTYAALGQEQRALEYYEVALRAFREVGDRSGEATALNNVGRIHERRGQEQKALNYYEFALPIFREVGDRRGEALMLVNIGGVYDSLGQQQKAFEYCGLALPIFREVGDRRGEAVTLSRFGRIFERWGQEQKALEYYEFALSISREVGDRRHEAVTLGDIALVIWNISPARAVFHAKQAVNIFQSLRADVGQNPKLQRSFANSVSATYRSFAQRLAGQDRVAEAQQVMDLLKGDEMGRLLRRSVPAGGRIHLDSRESALDDAYNELVEALAPLNAEAGALRRKKTLSPEEQRRLAKLEQKVASAEAKLKTFFDGIAGQLARPDTDQIPRGEENVALAEGLPPETVAIYTIAGRRSLTTILYTKDEHAVGEAMIADADLGKAVLELRDALSRPQEDVEAAGARLYELLIAPIAEKLEKAKAKTIVWSLDGPLRYVPLAVLRDSKRKAWLVEEYRNVVISMARHTGLPSTPTTWTALGFGVTKAHERLPALPGVEAELKAVVRDEESKGGAIPGLRLLDADFTLETMEKELKKHRPVVHIATHYVFEPPRGDGEANGSYLLLGDGSQLTLKKLDEMPGETFQGVDLLTLSACDTAVGAEDRPELEGAEVDGLAFVARQKGADAVMASLWSVNDASTAAFMAELYRRRAGGTKSKAEALQETQLAFLQGTVKPRTGDGHRGVALAHGRTSGGWTHPYYWAPFILIGNWM